MQKKLIALAIAGMVAAPLAMAQSNVTVYGIVDLGYLNSSSSFRGSESDETGLQETFKGSSKASSTGWDRGGLSPSRVGFRGTEDLGNGLAAHFQVEFGVRNTTQTGNGFGADPAGENKDLRVREQNLGLSGDFGRVTIGRQAVLADVAMTPGLAGMKNGASGTLYGNAGQFGARANELVTYVSPNFNGFTASAQFGSGKTSAKDADFNALGVQTDGTSSKASAKSTTLALNYANGPLALTAAYDRNQVKSRTDANTLVPGFNATDVKRSTWLVGGNYDFGVVRVFGIYMDGDRDSDTTNGLNVRDRSGDFKGWEIGAHVPVGDSARLFVSYFNGDFSQKQALSTNGVRTGNVKVSNDTNGWQLGGLYSLSARTTAYAVWGQQKGSFKSRETFVGAPGAFDDERVKSKARDFTVGLRHTF